MKKVLNKFYILVIALGLLAPACADLEVINETAPDAERALANPEDVQSLAGGAFRTWHNEVQEYEAVALAMGTMADYVTCSWGNSAMRDMSWEPRINSFPNTLTYAYFPTIRSQWQDSYAAIAAVNLVLQRLDEGMDFGGPDENALTEAFCYFVSGVSHGYLGLVFDQANIIPWDADISQLELKPWEEVCAAGLALLDQAIAIANSTSFEVPPKWVGGMAMTNVELAQLANGYAARILAYQSRTKAHNESIDWNQVLHYAQNANDFDFKPELGDAYDWYDMYWMYARYPGWGRVDHRIINEMDHDYPSRWPTSGVWPDGDPGEADPDDARLLTDYEYLASNAFPPDRGYYHFSHYRYSRYDDVGSTVWYGDKPKPSFLAWEAKLLEAEALFRTGNVTGAANILNDPTGPRKVRGGLDDVSSSDPNLLRLILDEKDIECFLTGAGIGYYDMRRTDRLQPATLLHFPVPATELEISGLPHYTINAVADGVDGSAGDWSGWDDMK
ncbi:MAG: hypothetical protein U9N72_12795 [Bacteroidota bacterium]|nr:hypothetical protein [Bacteroidota bacterium]